MAEHASEERLPQRGNSDVAPTTLLIAALASVAATAVVSRFGLAGTLLGAALTPVVLTVVREMARRPVQQVSSIGLPGSWRHWRQEQAAAPPDDPEAAPPPQPLPPPRRRRVRWPVVAAASMVGFLAAVAVFSVPDLIAGKSIVADRDSTFFSSGDRAPREPVAVPTATTTTETGEETATTPTTTAPDDATATETVTLTSGTAPTITAPPPDPAVPETPAPTPAPGPAPTP